MRILSWLGAFVLFAAVAYGTSAALNERAANAPSTVTALVAGGPALIAGGGGLPYTLPSPIPAQNPNPPAPVPAKPKAAPKAAPVTAAATHSSTAIVIRSTQQALINRDRARYGLGPLSWSSCLATIAYSNALRMANQGYISHTNGALRDLGCHLGYHAGENVGWYSAGISDTWANNAFMASPEHRANILSPYYHYVATYWVMAADGKAYIAVEFS
jgi:uncharacterized protein YkwD